MEIDFQVLSHHILEKRIFRLSCKINQTAKKAQYPNSWASCAEFGFLMGNFKAWRCGDPTSIPLTERHKCKNPCSFKQYALFTYRLCWWIRINNPFRARRLIAPPARKQADINTIKTIRKKKSSSSFFSLIKSSQNEHKTQYLKSEPVWWLKGETISSTPFQRLPSFLRRLSCSLVEQMFNDWDTKMCCSNSSTKPLWGGKGLHRKGISVGTCGSCVWTSSTGWTLHLK